MFKCVSNFTGKELACYASLDDAKEAANNLLATKSLHFYAYKCSNCKYYHLSPENKKLNVTNYACNCTDSNGNQKSLYMTKEDALKAIKKINEKNKSLRLSVYHCPTREGWHLRHSHKK